MNRRDQFLQLAEEWAEYEDEHKTLILGISLHYLVLYYFSQDLFA